MALTKQAARTTFRATSIELLGKNEACFKNGIACFDTSTGLVAKGFPSATLIPIGRYAEDSPSTGATKKVVINLFRELQAEWFPNATAGEAIVAANVGGLAYIRDDNTVGVDDDTNTLSVLGRIWKLDAVLGVLVEPLQSAGEGTTSGLD